MTRAFVGRWTLSIGAFACVAALVPPPRGAGQTSAIRPGETRAIDVRPRPFDPPRAAPSVVAHATASFDASRPLDVVVFLHGWHGCAIAVAADSPTPCKHGERPAEGLGVKQAVDGSRRAAIALVPQLAWRARNGSPGRFRDVGLAARWLTASLDALGLRGRPLARLTLAAHSAGFASAIAILDRGEMPAVPTDVVLLDALYARTYDFARWASGAPGRRLVVVHTDSTARETRRLRRWARASLGDDRWIDEDASDRDASWSGRSIIVRRTRAAHRRVPDEELAGVLRQLE